jgi:hypothetical protein
MLEQVHQRFTSWQSQRVSRIFFCDPTFLLISFLTIYQVFVRIHYTRTLQLNHFQNFLMQLIIQDVLPFHSNLKKYLYRFLFVPVQEIFYTKEFFEYLLKHFYISLTVNRDIVTYQFFSFFVFSLRL